jgi:hypothetical protein
LELLDCASEAVARQSETSEAAAIFESMAFSSTFSQVHPELFQLPEVPKPVANI